MAYKKDKSPKERVNRKEVRDSNAKALEDQAKESARLRAQNAGKPGYDDQGNQLTTDQKEKLKVRNKSITEDIEKGIDLEKLREEGTPGFDVLSIRKRDPKTQQGINRDVKENQTGDQILDPEGNFKKGVYKRPTLEQLKRRAALGISTAGQVVRKANPTATILPIATGALSLMIKGLQGDILRGY